LIYDAANTATFAISATGDLTIDASGNDVNFAATDIVHVLNTTASTTAATGALVIAGGLGVGGAENIGGTLTVHSTTGSSSSTTGALIVDGGLGVAQNAHVGAYLMADGTEDSTNLTTGAIQCLGGLAVTKRATIGTILAVNGTTESTTTGTGAVIITGGLGVGKNANIGGDLDVIGTITENGVDVATFGGRVTADATFSGPWALSHVLTLVYSKTAGNVTCYIPAGAYANTSSATITAPNGSIPAYLRPKYTTTLPLLVQDNSAIVVGSITVYAVDGNITISLANGNAFQNSGNSGTVGTAIHYISLSGGDPIPS
jgi:hypothetical protein